MTCDVSCTICPAFGFDGSGAKDGEASAEGHLHQLSATVHTIPARRLILHPKEWSGFRAVHLRVGGPCRRSLCPTAAARSSSFLCARRHRFGPARPVGADVRPHRRGDYRVAYRKFKREEIKELVFGRFDLLGKVVRALEPLKPRFAPINWRWTSAAAAPTSGSRG